MPTGKFQKICNNCSGSYHKELLKKSYFQSKEELDNLRDDATLSNWKILSKAYKLGKKIWGARFTKQQLSFDMDIPYTTVGRCLSLDRANKKSWKLVREKKLSVFKLAMICQLKSITYQDEIIEMVVADNLSTYQIKTLRVDNLKDINKERHRLAIEKGYSRSDSAYCHFKSWTERGRMFLLMDKSYLPKSKIGDINRRLKSLKIEINKYLK